MNLNTYKFIGAELKEGSHVAHIAFSGPIQLNERESENYVVFEVKHDKSFVRFYVEKQGVALTLEKLQGSDNGHPSSVATGSTAIAKMVDIGKYRLKIQEPSNHGKKLNALAPPETYMTITFADGPVNDAYQKGWSDIAGSCPAGATFPLALRQQK